MTRLDDYAKNLYSQFGEDGVIEEIFRRIGVESKLCVEFGAGNGLGCSNTAKLWRHEDWRSVLIETNVLLFQELAQNVNENCLVLNHWVQPTGSTSVDNILDTHNINEVDFMSIDVDGDDYWIFCGLKIRPRVVCVEFNKSVPPHLEIEPKGLGFKFGISAASLKKAGEWRGYRMIGITDSNMFFVRSEYAHLFEDLETDLRNLMPPENFAYLATDMQGRVVPMGTKLPWGLMLPVSDTEFTPQQEHLLKFDYVEERPTEIFQFMKEIRELIEVLREFLNANA